MSRWSAVSDLDYREELWPRVSWVRRDCWECGYPVYVRKDDPYQIHVTCGRCIQDRITREARRGQA